MRRQVVLRVLALIVPLLAATGCLLRGPKPFTDDGEYAGYYQAITTTDYEDVSQLDSEPVMTEPPPFTLDHEGQFQYQPISLEQAMQLAIRNNRVLRDLGGTVLEFPALARTILEPELVATDPRTGVEAALSEFDAVASLTGTFEKNDRIFNNQVLGGLLGGSTNDLRQDFHLYQAQLAKRTADGTEFALRKNVDYDANNREANLFGSAWNVNVEVEMRRPLLQGAGTQFNRIAGPGATPGTYSGVVIARLNADRSLADFQLGLRELVANVENAYWDLYFAYRDLDTKVWARDASLKIWRDIKTQQITDLPGGTGEAQARAQYFFFRQEVDDALSGTPTEGTRTNNGSTGGAFRGGGGVFAAERRLRLLLGIPLNDGRLLRPATDPTPAPVAFDWYEVSREALARREELHRQRLLVQQRELELIASRNFLLPQLDTFMLYRWRGFGHNLMSNRSDHPPLDNAVENLLDGDYQEWQMGFEFSMPVGFRRAHSAVRNAQLRLARDQAVLYEQEREVLNDLGLAYAEVTRAQRAIASTYYRRMAAREYVQALAQRDIIRRVDVNQLLDAQRRASDADRRYFQALVEYMLAVRNVHVEKGSLLEYNGIVLADGPWLGGGTAAAIERSDQMAQSYVFPRLHSAGAPAPGEAPLGELGSRDPAPGERPPAGDMMPANSTTPVASARQGAAGARHPDLPQQTPVSTVDSSQPPSVQPVAFWSEVAPRPAKPVSLKRLPPVDHP